MSVMKRWLTCLCVALAAVAAVTGCGKAEQEGSHAGPASATAAEAMEEAVAEAYAEQDGTEETARYADSPDQVPEEVFGLLREAVRGKAEENEAFLKSKDNFMIRTEFGDREGYVSIFLRRRDPDDHSGMDTANSLGLVYESAMTEYVKDQEEPWAEREMWYLAWVRDLILEPDGSMEVDPEGVGVMIFDSYEDLYQWYVGDNETGYAAEIGALEGKI